MDADIISLSSSSSSTSLPSNASPTSVEFESTYGFPPDELVVLLARHMDNQGRTLPRTFLDNEGIISLGREGYEIEAWQLWDEGIKLGGWDQVSRARDGGDRTSPSCTRLIFSFPFPHVGNYTTDFQPHHSLPPRPPSRPPTQTHPLNPSPDAPRASRARDVPPRPALGRVPVPDGRDEGDTASGVVSLLCGV